jgi:hypothetical protein
MFVLLLQTVYWRMTLSYLFGVVLNEIILAIKLQFWFVIAEEKHYKLIRKLLEITLVSFILLFYQNVTYKLSVSFEHSIYICLNTNFISLFLIEKQMYSRQGFNNNWHKKTHNYTKNNSTPMSIFILYLNV